MNTYVQAAAVRLPIPTAVPQTQTLDSSLDRFADETRNWLANVAPLDRALSSTEIGAILDRLQATQAQLQSLARQTGSNKLQQTLADVQNAIGVYTQLQQDVAHQEWQRQYYQQQAVAQAHQAWQFGMPPVGYPGTCYPYHN